MAEKEIKMKRVTAEVPEDTAEKLGKIAEKLNLSKSEIIRSMVENYVRGYESRNRR